MGFITNQWLKGVRERVRDHWPVKVVITSSSPDDWGRDLGIVLQIDATKERSYDYQQLHLTKGEVEELVGITAKTCSIETQLRIAADALNGLNDAQLVAFLSHVFRTRTAKSA